MSEFKYSPSMYVPFRDMKVIERCRKIKREDIEKHPNPEFKIKVMKTGQIGLLWITDVFARIKESDDKNKKVIMILPNPCPAYSQVAFLINKFKVNCRNLNVFAMDEYANEDGVVAPETWKFGFIYSLKKYLLYSIDKKLRPKEKQFVGPTTENVKDYGRMITDMGNADICYSGPGWTGHLAFIEPDAPEFDYPLDEWRKLGPRIVTLSPFTLAQNSLHGFFGKSGDLAAVPPKAFTIGPAEIIASKNRIECSSITVHGTTTSWERMIARLCYHGPVTPKLPTSILQELRTDVYISEENAQNVEPDWNKEY